MILIFTEDNDVSTKNLVEWLMTLGHEYRLISAGTKIEFTIDEIGKQTFILDGELLATKNIKSVYYRRGMPYFPSPIENPNLNDNFWKYNFGYKQSIIPYLFGIFNESNKIGHFGSSNFNKLIFLKTCESLDIPHPPYAMLSNKKDALAFKKIHESIITKSITIPFHYSDDKNTYASYTHKLEDTDFTTMPEEFGCSFVQKLINKKFEIRVFYLNGETYAMAIFSQSSEHSKVDFRLGYNDKKMKMCAMRLPEFLKMQVRTLMEKLGHNIGSLDILYGTDNEYYFLELNPVGQYAWLSEICNYNLDKILADELIKEKNT